MNLATQSITAISEATRQALIRYEWFPAHSFKVIYNGISARTAVADNTLTNASLGKPDDTIVFVTIARFDAYQRLYTCNN